MSGKVWSRISLVLCAALCALGLTASLAEAATPPTVTTNPADDVTAHTVRLNGSVDPAGNGEVTSCHFEYGTTVAYSSGEVPCEEGTHFPNPTQVSAEIAGLKPNTTYHFRLVAANASPGSSTAGGDQSFATPAASSSANFNVGSFTEVFGVAVDNSSNLETQGDVYGLDLFNSVKRFDSLGNEAPFTALGTNTITAGNANTGQTFKPADVAVNPANGDVYVSDRGPAPAVVDIFEPDGTFVKSFSPPIGEAPNQPGEPLGVAFDPVSGDVYVSDPSNHTVFYFHADGTYVAKFATAVTEPYSLAFDSAGNAYQTEANIEVKKFDAEGHPSPIDGVPGHSPILDTNGPYSVAVDPSNNNIYDFESTSGQIVEYDSSGAQIGTLAGGGFDFGLAVNGKTHRVYAADINSGTIHSFGEGAPLPDVGTGNAFEVTRTSAKLSGIVDPHGTGEITECYFVVTGKPNVPCEQPTPYAGSTKVTGSIAGLEPATNYPYHLVAKSEAGGPNQGQGLAFKTIDAVKGVSTGAATNVTRTSATLNGSLNPDGIPTTYHFEYGTNNCENNPCTALPDLGPLSDEPGIAGEPVSQSMPNLQSQTTYYYRLVAHNEFGTTKGPVVKTLTTLDAVFGVSTDPAAEVKPTTAILNGSLNPDGIDTHYYFKYGVDTNYGQKSVVEDAGSVDTSPSLSAPVKGIEVTGLQPNHTYHYRLFATNIHGTTEGLDRTFDTPSPPTISGVTSSNVTATSADLDAVINPQGVETEYFFEYGTSAAYGESAPVPAGKITEELLTGNQIKVHVTGLSKVVYHFRLVASNEYGTVTSEDQSFNFSPTPCPNNHVRQQTGAGYVPDCRAYELVSPSSEGNLTPFAATAPASEYATEPSRLAYAGAFGIVPGLGEPSNVVGDMYVATRTNEGWVSKFIGLPSSQTFLQGSPPWAVSHELYGPALWEQGVIANPSLSKIVSWKDGLPSGTYGGDCPCIGSSNAPYVWDPNGNLIGRFPTNVESVPGGEQFAGGTLASRDLTHFVFSSNIPFLEGGVPGDIYDNNTVTGTTSIISRAPNNTDRPSGVVKISADGSHILLAAQNGGRLFMRVNDEVTREVSQGVNVNFAGMTADGTKVYFTSNAQLTAEDEDTSADLYMWSEAGEEEGEPLKLVSIGNNGTGNTDACTASWTSQCGVAPISFGAYPQLFGGLGGNCGYVPTCQPSDSTLASANGDIYFYSPEQLDGSKGLAGQQNLYVYRNGHAQYVTTFAPGSFCTFNNGENFCGNGPIVRMDVTPDDTHAAFITASQITTYDNAGHSEMYSYEPSTDSLVCDSCIPSGAPANGDVFGSQNGLFLTNDGRAFFSTADALVSQDTNQSQDIYEYVEGRPQLITPGTSPGNEKFGFIGTETFPGLVGVSADGTDVYFATFAVLVGQDENGNNLKLYDARTDGGFPFVPPPPECAAADECHGPGSSPPRTPVDGTGTDLGSGGNALSPTRKAKHRHIKKRHHRHHTRQAGSGR